MATKVRGLAGSSERARLKSDDIVAAALKVLQRDGAAQFGIASVAAELSVYPRAVSWHVGSREDLLLAAVDAVFAQVRLPARRGRWDNRLRRLALEVRSTLLDYDQIVPLLQHRLVVQPGTVRVVESAVDALVDGGLRGNDLLAALNSFISYVIGFHLVELAEAAQPTPRSWTDVVREHLDEVSSQAGAGVVVDWSRALSMGESFAAGVDLLIAGISERFALG